MRQFRITCDGIRHLTFMRQLTTKTHLGQAHGKKEIHEAWDEIKHDKKELARKEMVQGAAESIRILLKVV